MFFEQNWSNHYITGRKFKYMEIDDEPVESFPVPYFRSS